SGGVGSDGGDAHGQGTGRAVDTSGARTRQAFAAQTTRPQSAGGGGCGITNGYQRPQVDGQRDQEPRFGDGPIQQGNNGRQRTSPSFGARYAAAAFAARPQFIAKSATHAPLPNQCGSAHDDSGTACRPQRKSR